MIVKYKCSSCGEITTILEFDRTKIKDAITCPFCGGTATKQLSKPSVRYKGDGFTKAKVIDDDG